MSEKEKTSCPKCGGNIGGGKSGSITQWVNTCTCALQKEEFQDVPSEIEVCTKCKKRIGEARSGSLTQWIFRSDLCACQDAPSKARPVKSFSMETSLPVPEHIDEAPKEMQVDPERFPVNRYAPLAILGTGSGGTVYLCLDRLLNKKLAVKLLSDLSSEQLVAFQGEARSASKLNHPNVVKVLDFGVTGGTPYMVMELIEGQNLSQILLENGPLDCDTAIEVFLQVCDGLAEAHRQGIYHRDIKSANIVVGNWKSSSRQVNVIDFGVASFSTKAHDVDTIQGVTLVGTPAYMSPDQASGRPYDARSEVYSAGCVLFEALTGKTPYSGITPLEVINKHAHDVIPSLSEVEPDRSYPLQLEKIVAKCLEKDPQDRFPSMEALRDALQRVEGDPDNQQTTDTFIGSIRKKQPASSILVASAAAFLIVLVLGATVLSFIKQNNEKQSTPISVPSIINLPDTTSDAQHFKIADLDGSKFLVSTGDLKEEHLKEVTLPEGVKGLYVLAEDIGGKFLDSSALSQLTCLYVTNTPLSDDGFSAISKLQLLSELKLSDMDISKNQLQMVSQLPSLTALDLNNSHLAKEALSVLGSLRSLEELNLSGINSLTNEDISSLEKLSWIHTLNLSYVPLYKLDLKPLERLIAVRELDLSGASVNKDNLESVSKLNLEILRLDSSSVTADGLLPLRSMKTLRSLSLTSCSNLPPNAVTELQESLPLCRIDR